MVRHVVQVGWQAAGSARASAQASRQAPTEPWQQAHDRSDKQRETG